MERSIGQQPIAELRPPLSSKGVRLWPEGLLSRALLTRGCWRALVPVLLLGLVAALVFWNDLTAGLTYYGGDTLSFYFPLTRWYAEQLRAGQIPLWFPYIYGGYPLFADGEIGMLYPLHLLAYLVLPPAVAFVWLRPIHFLLAGLFTYWLCRVLGLSRFGALLAGLTFSYASFLVSHLQHENIVRSTVWLPLAVGLLELGLRARGRQRFLWLLGCGVVVAIQMLGVHVQPVLLSLLFLGIYALVGPLKPRHGRSRVAARLAAGGPLGAGGFGGLAVLWQVVGYFWERGLAIALVCGVSIGLAAVQLLPLYQLGQRSMRGGGVSYEYSTSYSVPPTQLLQIILPYLFRPDQTNYFGLWSAVETTIYLGIAPLLLALVALAYLRSRPIAVFSLVAAASVLLSLGDYLPMKLYSVIWTLPGFSVLRVPARFSLLFVFAGAVLAGFAADWLSGYGFNRTGRALRVRRLLAIGAAACLTAVVLGGAFVLARIWLDQDPGGTRRFIETHYLSARRGEWSLSATAVYFGLLRSLDLTNPRTLGGLVLLLGVALWLLLRGLRLLPRRLWQTGLLALVLLDLVVFAQGFNPQREVGDLEPSTPAVQFLAEHNGLHRVFVEPSVFASLGPNRLVGANLDVAGGYSSLEPRRANDYWWSLVRQDTLLLDLYNVRYVVGPRFTPGLLAYEGTLYHPFDRLLHGAAGNPSGAEVFAIDPWWTEAVTVIGAGLGTRDVPVGTPLAEIVVAGPDQEEHLLLRAGLELGDGAAPQYGPTAPGEAPHPRLVWSGGDFLNPGQQLFLYGTTLRLERPLMASTITIRTLDHRAGLDIMGLGLHDREGLPLRSLSPSDRAKYRLVYQDPDVNIYENQAALPRAYLVGSAQPSPRPDGVAPDELLLRAFDPRQTVILDGLPPGQALESRGPAAPGAVELIEYSPGRIVARAQLAEPGFLVLTDRYDPDWRAYVDGEAASIYRANTLFRSVPLRPGRHEIQLVYAPLSVTIGAVISLVSVLVVSVAALWCWRRRQAG